jgi:hypothetical protein
MPLSRLGPLTVMVATLPYIKLAAPMFVPSAPPQAANKTLIANVVVTNLSFIISFLLLLQTLPQRLCLCLSLRTPFSSSRGRPLHHRPGQKLELAGKVLMNEEEAHRLLPSLYFNQVKLPQPHPLTTQNTDLVNFPALYPEPTEMVLLPLDK